jgi:hypothetical protein
MTPEEAVERLRGNLERARKLLPDAELHFYWWSVFPGETVESSTRALELAARRVLPLLR